MASQLECTNVEFLGYVAHPLMAAYLVKSDILINSFAKVAPQSIVNKIGDYLAAGKPIINTLENEEMCKLIEDYGFGVNIPAEDAKKLGDTICSIEEDENCIKILGKNARILAEKNLIERQVIGKSPCVS